jgi:hypothetical protein
MVEILVAILKQYLFNISQQSYRFRQRAGGSEIINIFFCYEQDM